MSSKPQFAPIRYPQVGEPDREGTEQARTRGFSTGYAEGLRRAEAEHVEAEEARREQAERELAAGRARVNLAVQTLERAVNDLNARMVPTIVSAEKTLTESALDLAEAVLVREVDEGHVSASDSLRRAMSEVPSGEKVTIRVSPDDAAEIGVSADPLVSIISDPTLNAGDCFVQMRDGWLDARITSGLQRAKAVLHGDHA